jgi:anti-sigma regulatory factor (Ser/Thr protein kinase)/NAD-dependent dihydropyrimidine dehydrogenase PreA subunit
MAVSFPIVGGDFASAGAASRGLKEQLTRLGVAGEVLRRVMIAAYEAEMNVVIHARRGKLWARLNSGRIDLEVVDEGPGIPDVEQAMREGWSTAPAEARALGFGAGMGLPNIRKASDLFEIDTRPGKGTRVRSTIHLQKLAAAEALRNAIDLRPESCRNCLACLAACPTRAMRLRDGRPYILEHLCINCTACLAACRYGALGLREENPADAEAIAVETLVVPQPFLGGFPQAGPAQVLAALRELGARHVRLTEEWEAGLLEESLRFARGPQRRAGGPVLAPVCPAVVNLVETHFPSLLPQLAPFLSPVEAARDEYGLEALTVVAACPEQYIALHPGSLPGRLRVLSPARAAAAVAKALKQAGKREPDEGEAREAEVEAGAAAARTPDFPASSGARVLHISGLSHVLRALEKAEASALAGVELLVLYACDQGCWGSPLFPEDPFLARDRAGAAVVGRAPALPRGRPFQARPGQRLDESMPAAIRKLALIDELARRLPGRDCGICGAPTCACRAEDIVLGRVSGRGCPLVELEEEK